MSRALLVIDIQNDYFPGGNMELVAPEPAAEATRRLLDAFRASGEPVVHLQHVWDAPDAAFMKPGTDGVEIHPLVAPAAGEIVLQKAAPNGFVGTPLEQHLRDASIDQLVVTGMMSSMCVDATTRAAVDLGFEVTLVHDACAAPALEFGGRSVDGESVHAASMAALGSFYAKVVSADEVLAAA